MYVYPAGAVQVALGLPLKKSPATTMPRSDAALPDTAVSPNPVSDVVPAFAPRASRMTVVPEGGVYSLRHPRQFPPVLVNVAEVIVVVPPGGFRKYQISTRPADVPL